MSSELEKIYKENKRGRYTYWVCSIALLIFGAILMLLHAWFVSIILWGISGLWFVILFRSLKEIAGNICQIAQVNPTRLNPETKRHENIAERVSIMALVLPIIEYLDKKFNSHVLITGDSGIGKTTLMKFLIKMKKKFSKETIVVFNFSPHDLYVKTSDSIIDVSKNAPDPFRDIGAFSSAYATAYHIAPDKVGYMARQISSVLNNALMRSKNFADLIKNLDNVRGGKDDVAQGILNQIRQLETKSKTLTSLDLSKDVVYDFSKFTFTEGKVFWAETILNMIWNVAKEKKQSLIIICDEAQHLVVMPTTKINEFLKEGRRLGVSIYASTQSYAMIDGGIRSNFATKFVFRTDDDEALNQLRALGANLEEVAHFARGEFTDVGFPELKKFVPIFYLVENEKDFSNIEEIESKIENEEKIEWKEETSSEEIIVNEEPDEAFVKEEETLRNKILGVLDKSDTSLAISRVAKALYKESMEKDEQNKVKLLVNNEINKLVKEDILDKQSLINERKKGKKESHVFRRNENLSKFHVTLQNRSVKLLKANNITILNEATHHSGTQGVDITLDFCDVEIETGLKDSLGLFDKSLMENTKPVIIVVPNYEQKERYSYLPSVQNGKAKCVLLPELIQAVKEFMK